MSDVSNKLILAVAGGRKTQGIVDRCIQSDDGKRILILTYTTVNQAVLKSRLRREGIYNHNVDVMGWYSFLLNEIIRPFLPFLYKDKRIRGFEFDDPYQVGINITEWKRYVTKKNHLRRVHAAHLAHRIIQASNGDAISRLERVYSVIYLDEVQDLCGYDLDILDSILQSIVNVRMVGDIRQAILSTNNRESHHKKYRGMKIYSWSREREALGRIEIDHHLQTWRCRPEITRFADDLFPRKWAFGSTQSLNEEVSSHDGLYLVHPEDVNQYVAEFSPLTLRSSASSGLEWDHLTPVTFGKSKGLEAERVLVIPTGPIKAYLQTGKSLDDGQAAHLYVAVTRAKQSVAFILDKPKSCGIRYWTTLNSTRANQLTLEL